MNANEVNNANAVIATKYKRLLGVIQQFFMVHLTCIVCLRLPDDLMFYTCCR